MLSVVTAISRLVRRRRAPPKDYASVELRVTAVGGA